MWFIILEKEYICGMKIKKIFIIILFTSFSCSDYRKLFKTEGYEKKLEAALNYYEEEEYYKASTLFEDIKPLVKGTNKSELVDFYFAYCLYHQKQYILSANYFKEFIELYSRSERVVEAEYLYGYSLYKDSPNFDLDQSSSFKAIEVIQNFINKNPYSEFSKDADDLLQELRIKIEKKYFFNAKQYFKTRTYKSAIIALKNFQNEFPGSIFDEESYYLIIFSQYTIAKSSFEELQKERFKKVTDYYIEFIDKYPNSAFIKEAEKMYIESLDILGTFAENK